MAPGGLYAISSALLFGASAPFAKLLVPRAGPLVTAALLYLGAGLALSAAGSVARRTGREEAQLRSADLAWLAPVVLFGGIVGPILMLWGLSRVSGVTGSLLLNLEAPLTALLGVWFFGDSLGARAIVASALVIGGASLVSGIPNGLGADPFGALAIAGACASWALDNNLTQRLSLRDPIAVARAKSLGAAASMFALIAARGDSVPSPSVIVQAIGLGAASYGASLVLAVHAMRLLGAARQAAFFASAPFIGALLAVPILGERPGFGILPGGVLILVGLILLSSERHGHVHTHGSFEHDHWHTHDEHHRHDHEGAALVEAHSHPHRHAPLAHAHPHAPDLHHRHRHESSGHRA
jgi:drug/metabolite transporter (DMT)-like permease